MMDRWINKKGYHADIEAVRAGQPDMLRLKYYFQRTSVG